MTFIDIDCLVKSGLLEFKFCDIQRACSIFDGILQNYPNRIDIWFVFIDQHVKNNMKNETRALFERILALGLKPSKMKSVFKKYADIERLFNDGKLEYVQEKAMEYLRQHNFSY